jgi:lipoprotein-anchoring transpeptidase ErfK/SrfK
MKFHPFFLFFGMACFLFQTLEADPEPSATPISMTEAEMIPAATPTPTPTASPSSTPVLTPKISASPKNAAKAQEASKKASKTTPKQENGRIDAELLKQAATQPLSIVISLSKQRVYLMVGGNIAVDSPTSTGKKGHETPKGEYTILEKDPNHQSNLYGDFVNEKGVVVKKGIAAKKDTPPTGAHYCGASMKFFMRLSPEGMGMHAGILPGYPASHGCIRLPLEMAKTIYKTITVKIPVSIID